MPVLLIFFLFVLPDLKRLQLILLAVPGFLNATVAVLVTFSLIELTRFLIKQQRGSKLVKALHQLEFPYYHALTANYKKEFERRVISFVHQKEFVPRGKAFEVTEAMKVSIAACATQLTFGLEPVYFSHFRRILVYPDRYYSTIFKRYHCGEVSMRGLIVLSWNDFMFGYNHASDGVNLGLHEMAHALHLENKIPNDEYNFLDHQQLQKWQAVAEAEKAALPEREVRFLRLYATTDTHEFFAVCVESFFERPNQFLVEYPALYKALVKLLNQDPARGIVRLV
ncbi:zinc-dependent peptidase [Pontibacter harenae]|uniref:zinc-dependent peptidase n=1 Tax=Pontibacter harenae TaxID=2894083 RepID=UPI001E2FD67B|nr:zinc-dependent peptidase [Pontibacter harenae]MCC9167670.1 zinc-dependent peptidase [Pontibacter harenae]